MPVVRPLTLPSPRSRGERVGAQSQRKLGNFLKLKEKFIPDF